MRICSALILQVVPRELEHSLDYITREEKESAIKSTTEMNNFHLF